MGLFQPRSDDFKKLESLCEAVGASAGRVATGRSSLDDFNDLLEATGADIAHAYSQVAASQGAKTAQKATKRAIAAAELWVKPSSPGGSWQQFNEAKSLIRQELSQIVDGPVH